jgi:hypothetical protein
MCVCAGVCVYVCVYVCVRVRVCASVCVWARMCLILQVNAQSSWTSSAQHTHQMTVSKKKSQAGITTTSKLNVRMQMHMTTHQENHSSSFACKHTFPPPSQMRRWVRVQLNICETHMNGFFCPASYSKMSTANSTSSVTRYRLGEGASRGEESSLMRCV